VGSEHTPIGIAAPSPMRAPPTDPPNKVTGSTIRRGRLDPPGTEASVPFIQKGYERMAPFEVSIEILNHITGSRLAASCR
jgi:hypothetical protein